jgi:preprotein translocase subunit SecY
MLANLLAAFALPELRKRILFVFGMFAVFVVGLHIPVPGINRAAMEKLVQDVGVLQLFDVFSGGAFRKFTIFALGITPYINASIIMQLLTVAWPTMEAMAKEGESGRKKIAQYTRYMTAILAVVQAAGLLMMLSRFPVAGGGNILEAAWWTRIQIILTLTAGTTFLMWVGELITERGIGQGVSLVIFASIMSRLPYDIALTWENSGWFGTGAGVNPFDWFRLILLFVITVAAIIYVTQATRRIPIQHAKRTVGNKVYQGGGSFLPFKVNTAGVIPIIFAISLLMFPSTILSMFLGGKYEAQVQGIIDFLTPGHSVFASLLYALMIMAFTYFYAAIQVNIPELSDNLKKYGSFIPGIRPGRPTQEYLDRVMTRITFAGAVFLAVVGILQYYQRQLTGVTTFSLVGGTSLLIVVGVALDTMQSLESHLVMRNYEGFIKQSR